jgi:ATP-binding cassette subfamily B protein
MKSNEKHLEMKTFLYVWKLIKYKPLLCFLNTLTWIVFQNTPLIPGLIIKKIFDSLNDKISQDSYLWILCVLLIVVALARSLVMYAGFRFGVLYKFYAGSLLRKNILKIILENPNKNGTSDSLGETLNILRDDTQEVENIFDLINDSIGFMIFGIVSLGILLTIDVKLTLLVFLPLAAVLVIAKAIGQRIESYRRDSRKASARVVGAMGEIFSYAQAIQLASAEKHFLNNLNKLNDHRFKASLKDAVLSQSMRSVFDNTVNIGTGLILLLSSRAISSGEFTVGDFALFIYFLSYVSKATTFIGEFLADFKQAGIAFERMAGAIRGEKPDKLVEHSELYLSEEDSKEEFIIHNKSSLEKLELRGLTHIYESTGGGIHDISFSLKNNSLNVIAGRIGSGKTTLLKTLLGQLPMQKGEIYWNGELVQNPSEFFIPSTASYTSQVPKLFSDTIKNNILLGVKEKDVRLDEIIYSAVLNQDINFMEKGIETRIGPGGVKLSGGQKQRLAVARMYARRSELYVIDDISSALDVDTEIKLWTRLFEKKGATCLAVSNRRMALQRADNIIVLKNGKIEAQGKLEELLENCEEMRRILSL